MAEEAVVEEVSAEELAEAKALGWADKDQWRGKPEHWVGARTFLDRGRHVLPIVQENNKRLSDQLADTNTRLASVNEALKAAQVTIDALEESRTDDLAAAAEEARNKLRDELTEASREGRHEDVAALTLKIADLKTAEEAPTKKVEEPAAKKDDFKPSPEFLSWVEKNPAFMADPRRVALADVVARQLRTKGEKSIGHEFLDKVADEVDVALGRKINRSARAEDGGGGGRRSGGEGGAGKTYEDLPAEAKAACERAGKRVVGPGRAHKDEASWRRAYTNKYFAQE